MKMLDNVEELDRQSAVVTGLGAGDEINVLDLLVTIQKSVEELSRHTAGV
jgi:hypothetical protein